MSSPPVTPEAARALVLAEVDPLAREDVELGECLGRVAAEEVRSPIDVQPFDNSAMDGYALRSADASAANGRLRLVGESRAGHPSPLPVGAGEAIWISTGAAMPAGADAVLPVEDATEEAGEVLPGRPVEAGENVRRAGEDVRAGDVLLAAGTRIGPAELAVLAACGVASIACARRPRVAIFGSGDELVAPGQPLGPGQIHDSNGLALAALAREVGAEPASPQRLPDDQEATSAAIAGALDRDVVIVAGGVSVGRHDHVKAALGELGVKERFWRVAMRPGGPTWFGVFTGQGRRTLVFGLPGNPVSAMVTFHLFARPALGALQGLDPVPAPLSARLAQAYEKKPGKAHFLRCRLEQDADGWSAHLTRTSQGSHVLTSMLGADGLAAIPAETERVAAGEAVAVEPLRDGP